MKKSRVKKLIKGTQGAVSILLACLMLPFFSLASMLVEMGRYQSTMNALDAAIGSSAYSTLSNYDSYVFERFGFLSVSQSSSDTNADMTKTLNNYLGQQKTVDMRGAEVESAAVNGLNSLAEIEVLKQQIQHYVSVIGPTKMLIEGFDINGLIAQIEKALKITHILEQLTSGFNLLSKEVAMLEAYEDAKKQMKEVQKAEKDYNNKFTSWTSAVQSLIDHLGTECPDSEDHPILYSNWQSKKSNLTTDAETARTDYVSSISTLISAFETLQSNITTAVNSQVAFAAQIDDFAVNSVNAYVTSNISAEEDKEVKNAAENLIEVEKALGKGAKSVNDKFSECSKGFSAERIKLTISELINEKNAVNSFSTSSISSSSSAPSSTAYHYVNLDGLTDPKAIEELMDETQSEIEGSGGLDIVLALGDIFNSLFKTELFADGRLNAKLDTTYYKNKMGGLPSLNPRTPVYDFLASDESRSKGYLAAIDPDYDPDDPFGLNANSMQSKLDAVTDAIKATKSKLGDIDDADWLIDKCKAVIAFGMSLLDLVKTIAEFIVWLVKELINLGYERMLSFVYLAYNLPNRTNFNSGVTLSGYSFAKISRPFIDTGTNIPVFGDILGAATASTEYSFVGAELEYVIWGNNNEIINQVSQFLAVYLFRLLINLPWVFANSEVQSIMNTLNAVPYVGPILGIGFVVLVALGEPLVDTIFLVNGGVASLDKSTLYLTPSGVTKMIGGFMSLKMSPQKQKDLTEKFCCAWDIENEQTKIETEAQKVSTNQSENPAANATQNSGDTKKPIIDMNKYVEGLLSFDYTQHCLYLMLVFGNEEKYLRRLADLIQCEMTMRNHLDKATTSQQVTGEYKDFNIYHAYSTVRVNATGTLKQMLPLPQLSNTSVFDRSFDRVLYRGY